MGEIYFLLGDYKNSLLMMSDVVNVVNSRSMAAKGYFMLGEANLELGNYSIARKNYATVYNEFPEDSLASGAIEAEGWTYFLEKRYDKAAEILDGLIKKYPEAQNLDSAKYRYAITLSLAGKKDIATEIYREISDEYLESIYAEKSLLKLGEISFNGGNYNEASEYFRQICEKYPNGTEKPRALLMLGQSLIKKGDYSGALSAFSEITVNYSGSSYCPAALFHKGICEFKIGSLNQAGETAGQFIKLYPNHELLSDVIFLIAETEYLSGDFSGAKNHYLKLNSDFPHSAISDKFYYGLGWSCLKTGDYTEALAAFTNLARNNGKSDLAPEANFRIGESLALSGKYDEAAETFINTYKNFPESPFADISVYRAGLALFNLKEYKKALEYFAKIAETAPNGENSSDAVLMKGRCLSELGRFPDAIKVFESVILSSPNYDKAQLYIADCLKILNEYDKAIEVYLKLAEKSTASETTGVAVISAMNVYAEIDKTGKAVALADTFILKNSESPNCPAIMLKKAEIVERTGNYIEAANIYRKFATLYSLNSNAPEALFKLAKTLFNNGEKQTSEATLEELRRKYPGSDFAVQASLKLGDIKLAEGKFIEAAGYYDSVYREGINIEYYTEGAFKKGLALLKNGDKKSATNLFFNLISRFPENIYSYKSKLAIAAIELGEGNKAYAKRLILEVLKNPPDQATADTAKKLLEEIKK